MQIIAGRVQPHINYVSNEADKLLKPLSHERCIKSRIKLPYFQLEKKLGTKQARLINRVDYWLNRCGKKVNCLPGLWIYNTIYKWAEQLNYSESTIKRIIKSLEEQKLLLSNKVNANKWNHTKWYSLNYEKLIILLSKNHHEKKWSDRLGQNEPIILSNKRINYTDSSNEERSCFKYKETNSRKVTFNQDLLYKIVQTWNKVFEYSRRPIIAYANRNISNHLLQVFNKHFNNDLVSWRDFAKMVNSSKFLMGEKKTKNSFKAIFSWLIQEDIILAIKSGGYGIGDRELDDQNISKSKMQKEKQILLTAKDLFIQKLKKTTDLRKEKDNFDNYVRSEEYKNDGDLLRVGMYICLGVNKESLLSNDRYEVLRNYLYKEFLLQKYSKISNKEFSCVLGLTNAKVASHHKN
jgi:hypothetical protein